MNFTLSQYEFKDSDSDDWHKVSESFVLDKLIDVFGPLTPKLAEMLKGKEISISEGNFRIKNYGNKKIRIFLDFHLISISYRYLKRGQIRKNG